MRSLVASVKSGDAHAVSVLFERYRHRVLRFCLSFPPLGYEDACDLTQEVFVRVFRNIRKVREPERFESWLFAIARHRCLTQLKRARTNKLRQECLKNDPELGRCSDGEAERAREQERSVVAEEIARLPESSLKNAGRLFYLDGLNTGQIAERLEAPVSTVTTWLDRFRVKVRRRLTLRILSLRGHEVEGG